MEPLHEAPGSGDEEPEASIFVLYTVISCCLTVMAGLMSGLTIGLMAMDGLDLEVLIRSGSETERKQAKAIQPLLSNHHFLLVTLVLWNAIAMEALPVFLDRLADPVTAVILSVTVVLVFGEIVPQSICTRYGLVVGYYSSWLVRLLMIIVCPIAWPVGKLLDCILGHEDGALERTKLQQFVVLHGEEEGFAHHGEGLTKEELSIVSSALDLTSKNAHTAMTPLEKVFMLGADEILDEECVQKILKTGHSRVPVHRKGDRNDIIGLILVKELLLKVHEHRPVSEFRLRPLPYMSANLPMYDVLQLFKVGRSHMALLFDMPEEAQEADANGHELQHAVSAPPRVQKKAGSGEAAKSPKSPPKPTSPTRSKSHAPNRESTEEEAMASVIQDVQEGRPVGIITIEDVIEELLGDEIIDETDVHVDNEKTSRVDPNSLSEGLPESLRALLALGFRAPSPDTRPSNPGTATPQQLPQQQQQQQHDRGSVTVDMPSGEISAADDHESVTQPLLPKKTGARPATVGAARGNRDKDRERESGSNAQPQKRGAGKGSMTPSSSGTSVTQEQLGQALENLQHQMSSNTDLADALTVITTAMGQQQQQPQQPQSGARGEGSGQGRSRPAARSVLGARHRTVSAILRDRHKAHNNAGQRNSQSMFAEGQQARSASELPSAASGPAPSTSFLEGEG